MKKLLTTLLLAMVVSTINAQQLTQNVRGTIVDVDSNAPLIGALVVVSDSDPILAAATEIDGSFKIKDVPIGRITLLVSYLGYENQVLTNLVVDSGKELVLQLKMQESAEALEAVEIESGSENGEALNEMALVGVQSISPEQTSRYAGGFNDPSRIMANFAGITSTQDGSNDIIVRGNAPKYIQWRLEGIQITNPNHFADQSAVSGAVSTLNNNILANSDFYTGAFAPEYGDVLSGVYDIRLRPGNNEKFESVFGFGLLGTDLTLEGPFKEGYAGSYLVNYRYSTATIIGELGLIELNGIPKFQDGAFKVVLPTEKAGIFSMFGLGGLSSFLFEDVTPAVWETPGDNGMQEGIREDFDKGAHLLNLGLTHTYSLSDKSYIKTTLAASSEGVKDKIIENDVVNFYDNEGVFESDSVLGSRVNFTTELKKLNLRLASTYNHKFDARNKLQAGFKVASLGFDLSQSRLADDQLTRVSLVDFSERINTIRTFVSWQHRFTDDIVMVTGLHNMNMLLNNKSTLEPRAALKWNIDGKNGINFGYGLHSTMESVHNYFAQVPDGNGSYIEPNKDLELLKAHHLVLGYQHQLNRKWSIRAEVYYQDLFDIPVENNDTSYYSTLNETLDFRYVELVNEGEGKNYGIELTVERHFENHFYFLVNGSLYESKYTSLEGVERNTQFNGNYLVNVLAGKEFTELGRNNNQSLTINTKIYFGGGKKIIPLLRDDGGELAVDPTNNQYWDYDRAYDESLEKLYQVNLSFSYKFNRLKATHEIFVNFDNLTDTRGKISEFYDEREEGNVGHLTQFGFFPNLMYRAYF